MDPGLRQMMLAYYNERAAEYEEAYTLGTGTASITEPSVFTTEIGSLVGVIRNFGYGNFIDLACGTGYWLPYYFRNCSRVTLFDQSERMLEECERKVLTLGIADRCILVRGDALDYNFVPDTYDSALVGFFLSHLSEDQEAALFESIGTMLRPSGQLLILDSAWTERRARYNQKVERQERRLNDGTRFEIYKRYLDRDDITGWRHKYGVTTDIKHFGDAFCAVSIGFMKTT